MPTVEIEVPEGYTPFVYPVKDELVDIAIECFASKVNVEYELDENGLPTEIETNTPADRARISITGMLDKQVNKYRKRKAADAVEPIGSIFS